MAILEPHLEMVVLPVREVLVEPRVATSHLYFIENGLASMVATTEKQDAEIEVGHIGREGVTGFHVLHDVDRTLNRSFMQIAGTGLRLPVPVFLELAGRLPVLNGLLLRYIHVYEMQLAYSALANARYSINARLARWLLMIHDRTDGDDLPLTHEFLSMMLGVRRSGVTNEIHVLEGLKLIRAKRANIRILHREGLERLAGGCYGPPEQEYARLITSEF